MSAPVDPEYARRRKALQNACTSCGLEPLPFVSFYGDNGEIGLKLVVIRSERNCEECGKLGLPGERMYRPAVGSEGWCPYCGMVLSGHLKSKFLAPRMIPGQRPDWESCS